MGVKARNAAKRILCVMMAAALIMTFIGSLSVMAAPDIRVVFTDVTNSDTTTLSGEMKVKVSIEGYTGRADTLQTYINFSGNVKYKSVEYLLDHKPFYVPQEPIKVNENKKLQLAAVGVGSGPSGAESIIDLTGNDDFCILTFEGTGDLTLTLDNDNSFVSYNNEDFASAEATTITVSPSQSDNKGVLATVKIIFDDMSYAQNTADSKIKLTMTNKSTGNSYYAVLDQRSLTQGGNLDTSTSTPTCIITQNILAGAYDLVLEGYGYTTVQLNNQNFNGDKTLTIEQKDFRAGDIDDDGKITLADYNLFMSVYKENYQEITGSKDALYFYDFNRDGKLDVFDLEIMKKSIERGVDSL